MDENLTRRVYLGAFLILGACLFYYQVIKGDYYLERAKNNYIRAVPLPSLRGAIYDRNLQPLAYDRAAFNIAVIPYQIENKKEELFSQVAQSLGVGADRLWENYRQGADGIFSPVDIAQDVGKETALTVKNKNSADLMINSRPQRYYPYGYHASHILGYVKEAGTFGEDFKRYGYSSPRERGGVAGVEQYYDTYLKGEDGGDLIEVDASGRIVGFLGRQKARKGKDIYLAVDARIQQIAYEVLGERRGVIIMMASHSGELLCLASFPGYDPNSFVTGQDIKRFMQDRHKPLLNRAIQSTYPLGSTFKPVVATAALEEGKITPLTTFSCRGVLNLGQAAFHCWSTHGQQNLYQALTHSCNVYFYNTAKILGPVALAKWAKRFGLDSPTEVDLPYEKVGTVPSPAWKQKQLGIRWYGGETLNFSIGQGFMESTPLALLLAINVFATDGYLVRPHLLKRIGEIESGLATRSSLGISRTTLTAVKKGMYDVVNAPGGTARVLKRLDLNMSGKTGTAQTSGKSHGWFVGFFPHQRIAALVLWR
jgi:penicillin-binding protein 2